MTTRIELSGWFQCRLATDPDAYSEPRGVDGWTFAFAGEPDLDRIIRFQQPVAPRSHSPQIGVRVTAVSGPGVAAGTSPLIGAPVLLAAPAVFEGRNGRIAPTGAEPVHPFNLRIGSGNLSLAIAEWLGPDPMILSRPVARERRGRGVGSMSGADQSAVLGGLSTQGYRQARLAALEADLANEADAVRRAALARRIAEHVKLNEGAAAFEPLDFKVEYRFGVPAGSRSIHDPANALGLADPLGGDWIVSWWMGCWDADALSGFVKGSITLA